MKIYLNFHDSLATVFNYLKQANKKRKKWENNGAIKILRKLVKPIESTKCLFVALTQVTDYLAGVNFLEYKVFL